MDLGEVDVVPVQMVSTGRAIRVQGFITGR